MDHTELTFFSNLVERAFLTVGQESPGYFCPPATYLKASEGLKIPIATVEKVSDQGTEGILLHVDWPEGTEVPDNSTIKDYEADIGRVYKLNHDFTFDPISAETDVSLEKILRPEGGASMHLTPDAAFYRQTNELLVAGITKSVLIVEFTTTRSPSQKMLEKDHDAKIAKYNLAIESKMTSTDQVYLAVIAVSYGGVHTSLPLSQSEVNELVLRFRTITSVDQDLARISPKLQDSDVEMKERHSKVREFLHQIELDFTSLEKFSDYDYKKPLEKMISPLTDEELQTVAKQMEHSEKVAHQRLKKDHWFGLKKNEIKKLWVKESEDVFQSYSDKINSKPVRDPNSASACVQFPFWIPKFTEPNSSVLASNFICLPSDETCMGRIWIDAISAIKNGSSEFVESTIGELKALSEKILTPSEANAEKDTSIKRAAKKSYRRVTIHPSDEDRSMLAAVGVQGLDQKMNLTVHLAQQESKKGFGLNHPTSDIDDLINEISKSLFIESVEQDELCSCINFHELVDSALKVHFDLQGGGLPDVVTKMHNAAKGFFRTPFGLYCQFISEIGSEICGSRSHAMGHDKYEIKKLRNFDCYLLIKTTRIDNHIFVSFLKPRTSTNIGVTNVSMDFLEEIGQYESLNQLSELGAVNTSVFKKWTKDDHYMYTDFVSFKLSKLENILRCASVMLGTHFYWREIYGIPFDHHVKKSEDAELFGTPMMECFKMSMMSLLVLLNDKSKTEEIITLSRFICMEGFSSWPVKPKPHKMVSKFPLILRSRLQVWLVNQLIKTSKMLVNTEGFTWISEDTLDVQLEQEYQRPMWKGLFNPFTHGPLNDVFQLVTIFYTGYLKNKNEGQENNQIIDMIIKILEPELNKPDSYETLGYEEPDIENIKQHEFSPAFLKVITKALVKNGEDTYGKGFKRLVEHSILDKLSSISLSDVATMKASSNFGEEWFENHSTEKKYHRSRVVENLKTYYEKKSYLYECLKEALCKVEDQKEMYIDLFRKAQHGGLREIYVLGIHERLVQLGIETIARSICSFFPSETMCTPDSKVKIPADHNKKVRQTFKDSDSMTYSSSDDAAKWNQNHMVAKFGIFLCGMTPNYMHGFILRGCNLFLRKKMMLPPELSRILFNNTSLKTDKPLLNEMVDAFHGKKQTTYMDAGKTYIKTMTGMMQGILHYTSSLLHTALNEWFKSVYMGRISFVAKGLGINTKILIMILQSSDDSLKTISCEMPESLKDQAVLRHVICLVFFIMHEMARFVSIVASVKCTVNTPHLFEFNSDWHCYGDKFRPTMRWVNACTAMSINESLLARQEEMSTGLTPILSGGGSVSLVFFCQLSQAYLYYLTLGLTTSALFKEHICNMTHLKDPTIGFFLLDNPYISGLGGFNYNFWKASKRSLLGTKLSLLLKSKDQLTNMEKDQKKMCDADSLENAWYKGVAGKGFTGPEATIRWGSRKKWLQLWDNLELPDDWRDQTDKDPSVLYSYPTDLNSLLLKLAEKISNPGVVKSVQNVNATPRMMAAGVYMLSHACMSLQAEWCRSEEGVQVTSLYNTGRMIKKYLKANGGDSGFLDLESEAALFPNHMEYSHLDEVARSHMNCSLSLIKTEKRKTATVVNVVDYTSSTHVSYEDLVKIKWFNIDRVKATRTVKNTLWEGLKVKIPWLSDSPEETLKKSPFEHHYQIKNFFCRIDPTKRRVLIIGAPVTTFSGSSSLHSVIRQNFSRCHVLANEKPGFTSTTHSEFVCQVKSVVSSIISVPLLKSKKEEILKEFLTNVDVIDQKGMSKKTRTKQLAIIQKIYMSEDDKTEWSKILDDVSLASMGTVGSFVTPQRNRRGLGVWSGRQDGQAFEMQLNGTQHANYLQCLTLESKQNSSYTIKYVLDFCRLNNIVISNDLESGFNRKDWLKKHPFAVVVSSLGPTGIAKKNVIGIPIFVDSALKNQVIPGNLKELCVDIAGSKIVARAVETSGMSHNLFHYQSRSEDLREEHSMVNDGLESIRDIAKGAAFTWIKNDALLAQNWPTMMDNIKKKGAINDMHDPYWTKRVYGGILYNTLRATAMAKMSVYNMNEEMEIEENLAPVEVMSDAEFEKCFYDVNPAEHLEMVVRANVFGETIETTLVDVNEEVILTAMQTMCPTQITDKTYDLSVASNRLLTHHLRKFARYFVDTLFTAANESLCSTFTTGECLFKDENLINLIWEWFDDLPYHPEKPKFVERLRTKEITKLHSVGEVFSGADL
jgi:hypothetical protein